MSSRASGLVVAAGLAGLGALAAATAATGAAARAQDKPVASLACGAYEAVPSGVALSGHPTRLSIQRGGRLLKTISDWRITRVECIDLDADKTPELLLTSHSGGGHCCETLRVWTLGAKPVQTLEYNAGSAGGFEARDLDADGRLELILGDDSFAYFDDLSYAESPRSLRLVACMAPVGFEDCTARFPETTRESMAPFAALLQAPGPGTDLKRIRGAALGVLAVSALLGEEASAIETLRGAVANDKVMKWLERARPKVRDWAQRRGKKLRTGRN